MYTMCIHVYTMCILWVYYMCTICILCAYDLFTMCILSLYYMCTIRILYVYYTYAICILCVHHLYTIRWYCMYTISISIQLILHTYYIYTICIYMYSMCILSTFITVPRIEKFHASSWRCEVAFGVLSTSMALCLYVCVMLAGLI
jgi:hypothetical protein